MYLKIICISFFLLFSSSHYVCASAKKEIKFQYVNGIHFVPINLKNAKLFVSIVKDGREIIPTIYILNKTSHIINFDPK